MGLTMLSSFWHMCGCKPLSLLLEATQLITMQVVGFGMWGALLASTSHGLGKSYDILDSADITQVQQVSGNMLALPISYKNEITC
jgi:hypothetical protein